MKKEWKFSESGKTKSSATLVERLLATRGITKAEDIKEFLNPLEIKTTHPSAFTDMEKAIKRLSDAIDKGENILIYGDFDADGVTSTALLYRTLTVLNAKIDYFIPEREKEGHGLNSKALVKLLTTKKPKVIITVDCGVSDVEQVQFLNSFKVDVIITDHHEAPETLPPAVAIINPKAQNALDEKLTAKEILHLTSLAGVGVAFKLAQGLLEHYKKLEFVYEILPYVAVGTISDIVPLIGENRYFVAKGLELISNGKHYGIKRLLEEAGYTLESGITSENIAFGVAPRINASGRLDSVDAALKVLISDNKQEIEMSIITLNDFNRVRQELCENVFLEAEELLQKEGNTNNSIILFSPKWHIGIIGIVASKLVEKYYKPTFLMTYSEETKQIRCSARSVEGVHLYDVISANSDMLDGFGGHAMAAGLAFSVEKIAFEDVKNALDKTITEILDGKELKPILNVDLELKSGEIDFNLITDIEKMQPFGAANPNPVFVMNDLTLLQKKLMGSNRNHLKLNVQDTKGNTYDAIWWSKGDVSLVSGDKLDMAFCPQTNTFNKETKLQLIIQDIHSENLIEEEEESGQQSAASEIKIYDHRKKTDIFKSVEDYVTNSKHKTAIFAEEKMVLDRLKSYKGLYTKIFNRTAIKNADILMFFDYPSTKELMDEIISKTSPKQIHYMHHEVRKTDEKDFLKTFSGMIKYACNNNEGKFNLDKCSTYLAKPKELSTTLLEIFEECGMINILNKNTDEFHIEFSSNIEISKALHTEGYERFIKIIKDVEKFKTSLLEDELIN